MRWFNNQLMKVAVGFALFAGAVTLIAYNIPAVAALLAFIFVGICIFGYIQHRDKNRRY